MHSLSAVVALARDASMSASYKPALLKALVRLTRSSNERRISLDVIGGEYVSLYWVQTVTFRLRQAATVSSQPEVVRAIRAAADAHGVRRLRELPADVRARLEREMARILRINVLAAFHSSAPAGMPRLFDWSRGDDAVTLSEQAFGFLRREGTALESLSNLWWARYLEKVNVLAPLVIRKVERTGAEKRTSLARYLRILEASGERACFYCERSLADRIVHVDHVIPWSFLLDDPLWDLVLSCAACNLAKSDVLPDRRFLQKLVHVGIVRSKMALPVGFASPFLPLAELDRYFDAALAVEWPAGWAPPLR